MERRYNARILDGHYIFDFVDPDILQRPEELGGEEGLRQEQEAEDDFEMDDRKLNPEEQEALAEIRKKKSLSLLIQQHRMKKSTAESRPTLPRKFDKERKARSQSRCRKRERSLDRRDTAGDDAMDVDGDRPTKKLQMRYRSRSQPSGEVVPGGGFKDSAQEVKALKLAKKSVNKRNKDAQRGEADRVIPTLKLKHLFSGKRSIGKSSRR
ncbi:hypothetical protein F0562_006486 [Nyssa sinensis]|uniref:Uncharacterized protein n=1 Tax=Nyssa sinensis TaxID=561372 RepID=A0A5J5AQZ7_9ASTE|nr:hypothetical protein F0562_006486 [Nyssa sinensis]